MDIRQKHEKLIQIMREMKSFVVAFSGGVDSTFLLKVAQQCVGDQVAALTITSPFHANWEIEEAKTLAQEIGVEHVVIAKGLDNEELKDNPVNRCYLCKKDVFGEILSYAKENGYAYVVDGSNFDDTFDYRPGMQALKELGVRSPLLEAGLTKEEIRTLSKELGLSTWDKPAYACLLTRIPYGQTITLEGLDKIQRAENVLFDRGFRQIRVRMHGEIARIEVGKEELSKMFDVHLMQEMSQKLKQIGFQYVTLDMEGYQTGSLNQGIEERSYANQ